MENTVPRRIASIIINSLKGGVVPRVGLEYVTVGAWWRLPRCCTI
jgi:hypothetical protein